MLSDGEDNYVNGQGDRRSRYIRKRELDSCFNQAFDSVEFRRLLLSYITYPPRV